MLFKNILDESNRKPNKMRVDKSSEFYNRSIKSWLQDINIQLYSTHNEKKLKDLLKPLRIKFINT